MTTNRKWLLVWGLGVVVILGLSIAGVLAQEKPVEPTPILTEVQTLKLQNFALQAQTIQSQMALLQAAMREVEQGRETLIQSVEKEHPGWLLSRQTLKWERAPAVPAPARK